MIRSAWVDEYLETAVSVIHMKVDLEELLKKLNLQLLQIEEREAHLQKQLHHLTVVESLATSVPDEEGSKQGLDMDHFRQAILGGQR